MRVRRMTHLLHTQDEYRLANEKYKWHQRPHHRQSTHRQLIQIHATAKNNRLHIGAHSTESLEIIQHIYRRRYTTRYRIILPDGASRSSSCLISATNRNIESKHNDSHSAGPEGIFITTDPTEIPLLHSCSLPVVSPRRLLSGERVVVVGS